MAIEVFPIAGVFRISRGARRQSTVVRVVLTGSSATGQGECVPYAHYGETPDSVCAQIESVRSEIEAGLTRAALMAALPAGAARNAVDAALWDLEARSRELSVAEMAGLQRLAPVETMITIGLDEPESMARRAREYSQLRILKLKLAGDDRDLDRVAQVRGAAPNARLVVDANEAFEPAQLQERLGQLHALGVLLVEQPVAPAEDEVLEHVDRVVPVVADEAFHTIDDLERLRPRYDVINLKLDKTGGLTHALEIVGPARRLGFEIMVGCMVGTSLSIAPALVLAQHAAYIDLDAPYLLARDRQPALGLTADGTVSENGELWGGAA